MDQPKRRNKRTDKPKKGGENGLCVGKNKLIDEIDVGHMAMESTQKWKTIQRRKDRGKLKNFVIS